MKKTDARCDSFVLETDVHFPTDLNLLWDAVRKALQLSHKMADLFSIAGWRQTPHNIRTIKSLFRLAQKQRDKDKKSTACIQATRHYIDEATKRLLQAEAVAADIQNDPLYGCIGDEIQRFVDHGRRQIDQISRRCFNGETIAHREKVFSLFEEHTEWISKGKAGVPQELGLRVCIVESSTGFILHHRVMQQETDDSVAVSMIKETQRRYSYVRVCSFDKGFHSPKNQEELAVLLDLCVLPRKGKLSYDSKILEGADAFGEQRRKHSAVESAINALENHGLDRCCDQGIIGFKRYVALAVVARNLQLIGVLLQRQELEKQEDRKRKAA